MSTLDEITTEKQRVSEALARLDLQPALIDHAYERLVDDLQVPIGLAVWCHRELGFFTGQRLILAISRLIR